jgi:UDP-N-acetylmuramoyl-tripeptide--D-alanyl-D-alanine ligase
MAVQPYLQLLFDRFKEVRRISTDTRTIEKGSIFFALKGARFDGNQFAMSALESGASLAVVDDPKVAKTSDQMILVPDSLKALQDLANIYAKSLSIPRLGITGSNGKTTVKELINSVLAKRYRVHSTSGNYNNHIGVPLTILSCPLDAEIMVLEMGANKKGDIKELVEIGEPTHGLVTVIGKAHLEGMGGIEGVKKTKAEMYDFLADSQGIAFVANHLPYLMDLSSEVGDRVIYGQEDENLAQPPILTGKVDPSSLYAEGEVTYADGDKVRIKSHLFGAVHFNNIMTALAVGKWFGVDQDDMVEAIENYQPGDRRIEWIEKGGHRILMDAYNANPDSTSAAIEAFEKFNARNKILVLGEMLELGEYSEKEHRSILDQVSGSNWKAVVLMGNSYKAVVPKEMPPSWYFFENFEELANAFYELTDEASTILVKGSRGNALERITDYVHVLS